MSPLRSERRVKRFSNPADALACWLEASRRRGKLRNLALADDLGILVSGSGSTRECDELAAWAPIALKRGGAPPELRLSGVKLPGFDAYVCTDTETGQHTEVLRDVAIGCARILGRPSQGLSAER
jgi:hypothetical protein